MEVVPNGRGSGLFGWRLGPAARDGSWCSWLWWLSVVIMLDRIENV
jgi:hypothetical protein